MERLEEKLYESVEETKRKGRKLCSRVAFSRALLWQSAPHQAPEKGLS